MTKRFENKTTIITGETIGWFKPDLPPTSRLNITELENLAQKAKRMSTGSIYCASKATVRSFARNMIWQQTLS